MNRIQILPKQPAPTAGLLLAALLVAGCFAASAGASPPARTRLLREGTPSPICIASAPGDHEHIFVCERAGKIRPVDRETGAQPTDPFLDISQFVSLQSDDGLLGLAFDPDYQVNGYFYVNYITLDAHSVLARYHASPGSLVADPQSETIIWKYPRPTGHNGGWIGFSPVNGYLYITAGDGDLGGTLDFAGRAQDITDQRLGKIHRIDPSSDDFAADPDRNYAIPPSNPFVGVAGDDEIWAYGMRNPWRASFDRATGDLYFGDVGQDTWEEINVEPASSPGGRNYGWPCMEGKSCTVSPQCVCNDPGLTLPVLDLMHNSARSITGGYVYRGASIPDLHGHYIFGDFLAPTIRSFVFDGSTGYSDLVDRSQEFIPAGSTQPLRFIAALGEDTDGELYFADIVGGRVYKLVPYPCEPVVDRQPESAALQPGATISLSILAAGQDPLSFQWRKDGIDLQDDGRIQGAQTTALTITNAQGSDSGLYDIVITSPCGETTSDPGNVVVSTCRSADINHSGAVTVQDIFDFLAAYFGNAPAGDFNESGTISVQDIFDFLAAYFAGCI